MPIDPGYYWVRNLRNQVGPPETSFYPDPQIVEIVKIVGRLEVEYLGDVAPDRLYNLSGEWYGPLGPPPIH